MRSTFVGVDVVGEGKDRVLESRIPLHGHLYVRSGLLALEVEHCLVDRILRLVYVSHEVPNTALVAISYRPILLAPVGERDLYSLVQKRRLAEPTTEGTEG